MANEPLHLSKSPIIEAVISIQISQLTESSLETIKGMRAQVEARYPRSHELSQTVFTGQVSPEGPKASATQRAIGMQFQSADTREVFQARLDGFSFHRLAPYENWQTFRGEASRLWVFYRAVLGPVRIQSYSIRYINKIPIPLGHAIERYLKVYPVIPGDLPQLLNNYVMRLELRIEGGIWIMHQAQLPPEMPGAGYILLDNELRYYGLGLTDQEVWDRIDGSRHEKNRIFLGCLTEELKGILS